MVAGADVEGWGINRRWVGPARTPRCGAVVLLRLGREPAAVQRWGGDDKRDPRVRERGDGVAAGPLRGRTGGG